MQIPDWGKLSLGEWIAACHGWNKARGQTNVSAPTDAEFEAAVRAARTTIQ